MNSSEIVRQLSIEEKASLCSGANFWQLKSIERMGLKRIMVTDGPHGLRKQSGNADDHLGMNKSVAATCFPTASATASSFDRDLLRQVGEAIGEECLAENVAVVLGPGANIKRSPLCGRNFEYISEDPFVTGALATAMIQGVQSRGVGTSLKHFALNNQERLRMVSDSVVDERAMREIYLAGFEAAVREAQPYTVMSSYNRVNGVYASEHRRLLTEILREEWGFEGLVVTDWGAVNDRVEGVRAGLDLEMPSSDGYNDAAIVDAVRAGTLFEDALDLVVERVVDLILKTQGQIGQGHRYDPEAHHALARRAAAESAVLLKNESAVLPISADASVAIIGTFAKKPRYQGAGSSKINPYRIDATTDELDRRNISYTYASGYSLEPGSQPDEALIREACEIAHAADLAVVFAGLPDEYESEGIDRVNLSMPESHNRLIEAVAAVNPKTVVVLQMGAPVTMPWKDSVSSILLSYLGGEAGGSAIVENLYGDVNPSGKLAETFPLTEADVPCVNYFSGDRMNEEYRESIYVGYRYYDKVDKPVLYPFGHGLSYTNFRMSDMVLRSPTFCPGDILTVSVNVKNIGEVSGAEVVQIYVGRDQGAIYRPARELRGFSKVYLAPGEQKTVSIELTDRSFSYYNAKISDWAIEGGDYKITAGNSSRNLLLESQISVQGDGKESLLADLKKTAPVYYQLPDETPLNIPPEAFVQIYGGPLPIPPHRGKPFTVNSTLADVRSTFVGRQLNKMVLKQVTKMFPSAGDGEDGMMRLIRGMMDGMPLRGLMMMSGGALTPKTVHRLLRLMNGFRKK